MQLTTIPVIETDNFRLRGMKISDAEALFSFMKQKETMRYITPNPVTSVEELQKNIQGYLDNFHNHKEIPWVITDLKTNQVIGQFRLHKLNYWHKKTELGVVISDSYQRKGVMTELLGLVLTFIFETLDFNRVVGDIFADNEGSRKLLEKYGFTKEGVLRQTDFDGENYHDTVVYSMLKSEYNDMFK
ncbi:GNAT family N-acetyltransferase [Ornithinibacillus halophilus]|uniref:Ribosomal-protein-alanine N-acetyltransferase n=1 Tax=Ornithinibacillus halophilus TaxID=930117 RepID=A0A1M5KAT1_9BACI|nr:GNAT family protein [Ornithinibacillus halophilus]SHG49801.1 ribosomal-protein-alanine N-acetyltransferase [Ornithinibacillus halophilus]